MYYLFMFFFILFCFLYSCFFSFSFPLNLAEKKVKVNAKKKRKKCTGNPNLKLNNKRRMLLDGELSCIRNKRNRREVGGGERGKRKRYIAKKKKCNKGLSNEKIGKEQGTSLFSKRHTFYTRR